MFVLCCGSGRLEKGGRAAPVMGSARSISSRRGLCGRRSAGRRIVEEKLLVNRYDEGLNVPHFKERT